MWNLPGIGLVEGVYRRAAAGAALYPALNWLGSRNWHWGDRTAWPEYGEVETVRQQWNNGATLIPVPSVHLVGDQSCFGASLVGTTGEGWAGVIEGYDARCWNKPRPQPEGEIRWPVAISWTATAGTGVASFDSWPLRVGWTTTAIIGLVGGGPWPLRVGWTTTAIIGLVGGGPWPLRVGWTVSAHAGSTSSEKWPIKASWTVTAGTGHQSINTTYRVKVSWRSTGSKHP